MICQAPSCLKILQRSRIELGYSFCVSCVEKDWSLIKKTPVIITGQHKGQNLVCRPTDTLHNYNGESSDSLPVGNYSLPNSRIAARN